MTYIEQELLAYLHRLHAVRGPRPAGSPGNYAAATYIEQSLAEWGFAVERQPYPCPLWDDQGAQLEVAGQAAHATANAFSPPCDLWAGTVPVATLGELRTASLRDKVAVFYGDLVAPPRGYEAWVCGDERTREIETLLDEGAPAALLTVQANGCSPPHLAEHPDRAIPSASVSVEIGRALVERPGLPVHLRIASTRAVGTAWNIVGHLGQEPGSRVLLCAHFDTRFAGPRVRDNAASVAVLLALGRLLAQHRLRHALELVAFNSEECAPLGVAEYVRRRGDSLSKIVAVITFDGLGQWLHPTSLTTINASLDLATSVRHLTSRYPGIVLAEAGLEAHDTPFAGHAVPCLALGATAATGVDDVGDPRWFSPRRMREATMLGAELVALLQAHTPVWGRG